MNGADGDDSTTNPAADIWRTTRGVALLKLIERLQETYIDYAKAAPDDHQEGRWAQLDAAIAQCVAFIHYLGVLSPLHLANNDGGDGREYLYLLTHPLKALLAQLKGLEAGDVGPLLQHGPRPRHRRSVPLAERLRRSVCVAALTLFEMSGMTTPEAAQEVVRIRGNIRPLDPDTSPSDVVLRWRKELREKSSQAAEAIMFRFIVEDAEQGVATGKWRRDDLREDARVHLRQLWP